MKRNYFKYLAIAICAISLIGCKQKENPSVESIEPSFYITGTISTEDGLPLEGIQVCVDTTNFALDLSQMKWQIKKGLSNKEGLFGLHYMYKSFPKTIEWPSEVTLIATDTTDMYESQTRTYPIQVRETGDPKITNGLVSEADFVMHKK
ncbi:MAG: hypothetical protein K6A36_07720 [Paludibacteraceae bacterium]|nr:hypothetical protein [Paludibacteraceae bacterium]